ncbi:MAG TPA: hypothetical protein VK213_07325 [Bacteroidales bacterium]|nr:hypothetical protein [Bacteroidales bacterium]
MAEKTILNFHGLEVRVADEATNGIIDILNHTIQGSEGGLRFSLQNAATRIREYGKHIRFLSLYRKNKITGTCGACFRLTGTGNMQYHTTYIRYLAFHPVYQSSTDWKKKENRSGSKAEQAEDSFKRRTLDILSKPSLLDYPEIKDTDKHIMYAFVESMNERSKNLVHQAGFEYIRSFLTVAFSRFSPKTDNRVSKLKASDYGKMRTILKDHYRDHSFFHLNNFFPETCYALEENGQIAAAVSAVPGQYKIYDMPGIWGWVIMKVLPRMPYFKRLFQPGLFRYLVFDYIYCLPGREELLAPLFETACASEGFNTALTWMDDRTDFYDKLRTEVKMGALNRMLNAKPGLVYARFINFTEADKESFYNAPAYVSGYDMT